MALRQPLSLLQLSRLQWLGWGLAAAGKLFEGVIVFIGGMALPSLTERFGLTPLAQGAFASSSLLGILVGALGLGWLADRIGRRWLFSVVLLLLALGLLGAALTAWRMRNHGFLAWPNISAGRMVVPERVGSLTPAAIAQEAADWLGQPQRLEGMREDLRSLRGQPGAVAALAALVRQLLPSTPPGPAARAPEAAPAPHQLD